MSNGGRASRPPWALCVSQWNNGRHKQHVQSVTYWDRLCLRRLGRVGCVYGFHFRSDGQRQPHGELTFEKRPKGREMSEERAETLRCPGPIAGAAPPQ